MENLARERDPDPQARTVAPPTGTVTFLFTDIEGSTRLWQEFPGPMTDALARHHALLQHAIESHGGYVFQIVGDAFCAAFRTPAEGLAAGLAGQRALQAEPWGPTGPLRVRMALHTGGAEAHAGQYRSGEYASGLTLSRAARLLAAGHGGQILLSQATQELVRDALPPRVALRDLGERRLRDLVRPEHVFQVETADLPSAFPPLKTPDALQNNLPIQLTTFVGRERELSEIKRLLTDARLLTLTGPGGTGKTRLSVQAAGLLLDRFPDGVWLVELAPLSDAGLVPQAVASALALREEAGRSPLAILTDHLRSRSALLVLDNCEHLVEACARLAEALLRACPHLEILATSREPLGVAGEVSLRVPSLSLPAPGTLLAPEHLAEVEAVRLFIDRARAVKPEFAVTSDNAAAVAEICRRLDGIPLAIELAAARVKALTAPQIADHLNERFRLLTGGSRTALPRHRTLRGLIDWSYELLAAPERALLRRLSVFAGGFTLEAATAVCAGDGVAREEVLDLLGRLVDKSLVMMADEGGEARYRLLETIRQYGREKLEEGAEADLTCDRHRDFYLRLAEAAEPRLHGAEPTVWLERLEVDHDNLRAALRWSLERGDVEISLRLGGALRFFWDTRAHVSEGHALLDAILARAGAQPPGSGMDPIRRLRARALDGLARLSARRSDFARARTLYGESLQLWRELGDRAGIAEALNNLADVTQFVDPRLAKRLVEESLALFRDIPDRRGIAHALSNLAELVTGEDQARARRLLEESVPLFREIGDARGLAHGLNNLGGILTLQGDYGRAEALYRESLALARELDDRHAIAVALRSLGSVAHHRAEPDQARSFYEESATRFLGMGDRHCAAKSLLGLGRAAADAGDHPQARALGEECLALFGELDVRSTDVARTLHLLGRVALREGDRDRAAARFLESLALGHELQDAAGVAMNLEDLAGVAEARADDEKMVRLLGAADALRVATGILPGALDRDAHERAVATARARLGDEAFAAAWARGAALTPEQAIALAAEGGSRDPR